MNEIVSKLDFYYNSFLGAVPRLALAICILIIGLLVTNYLTAIIRKKIRQKSQDQLMRGFLSKAIKLVLIVCIFILTLNAAGLGGIAGGIMATAGASAVILGFAFKDIAENFLAGIILAFNRPFHVDDTVQIESVFGKVQSMEFRYTKIRTFDGRNVYIPNSDVLTKPVFNYTEDGFFRTDFIVGIAYEDDPAEAIQLIQKSLNENSELVQDQDHINFAVEDELAPSTYNIKVYIWISTDDFRRQMLEIRGRTISTVKKLLEEKGYNLPANITEVKFYQGSNPIRIESEKQKEN